MGILNVTPDSFSDGGHFYSPEHAPERALAQALTMLEEGADILDIGGESTRPNATPLAPAEEQTRILPVIEAILQQRPGTILSVDTFHATTARRAVEAGAEIVNDVSGHLWDPDMSATCAELNCGAVLMHTRGRPQEWTHLSPLAPDAVLVLVLTELAERLKATTTAGIPRDKIVLDPGFGFGKTGDRNYYLLVGLEELGGLGQPLLAGVSRKSFLGRTLSSHYRGVNVPVANRGNASIAAVTATILAGAHMVRVHDVRPAREAAAIADAILAAAYA